MSSTQKAPNVIEILSDSEPEAPVEDELADLPEPSLETIDPNDQPLLRAAGIKYKTRDLEEEKEDAGDEEGQPGTPASAKRAPRPRRSGVSQQKRVNIETPISRLSDRRKTVEASALGSGQQSDGEVFKTPLERKHIKFDDSDHDEFLTPMEGPAESPFEATKPEPRDDEPGEEEDAEEESDDEAPPEAVSTRVAEAETLKAAKAAAKAAEQQAAELKRKRQERDARLKRQAEERKRSQKATGPDDEDDEAAAAEEGSAGLEKRKRETPKLLPLELLESDDEEETSNAAVDAKQKRRKLGAEHPLLRDPKHPKDKRVGSTAYRVVKSTGDARLAPKAAKQTVNLREMLLRRDRAPLPRGGFFVRKR
ncbi:hypothetical protein VTJ49DRAFT_385 [Mycothermus thermophilus]|uniref:Uncharacterized protein n=1 Tax=Humicola insolens TaxID=85995 RepID=A0ABR3VQC3_HUMIN